MKNKETNLENYFPFTVYIVGPCENQKVNFKDLKETIPFINQLKINHTLVYNTLDGEKEYVLYTNANFSGSDFDWCEKIREWYNKNV